MYLLLYCLHCTKNIQILSAITYQNKIIFKEWMSAFSAHFCTECALVRTNGVC